MLMVRELQELRNILELTFPKAQSLGLLAAVAPLGQPPTHGSN